MPTFKIIGQIYHQIDSILQPPGAASKILHIYFVSNKDEEVSVQIDHGNDVNSSNLKNIQQMLKKMMII